MIKNMLLEAMKIGKYFYQFLLISFMNSPYSASNNCMSLRVNVEIQFIGKILIIIINIIFMFDCIFLIALLFVCNHLHTVIWSQAFLYNMKTF